jgi:hypothetical protein
MAAEAAEAAAEPGLAEVRAGALALLGMALVDRGDIAPGREALTRATRLGQEPLVAARAAHGTGRAVLVAARTGADVDLSDAEASLAVAEQQLRQAGEAAELCAVLLTTAEVALAQNRP